MFIRCFHKFFYDIWNQIDCLLQTIDIIWCYLTFELIILNLILFGFRLHVIIQLGVIIILPLDFSSEKDLFLRADYIFATC